MSECNLCGKETNLVRAEVEGSTLNVCQNCGKFGKVLRRVAVPPKMRRRAVQVQQPEIEEVIVDNYSTLIRRAREKSGMKREDFAQKLNQRESLIQKWECGSITPNLSTAKKLEKILHIKLIARVEEVKVVLQKGNTGEATLGDFVKVRKR